MVEESGWKTAVRSPERDATLLLGQKQVLLLLAGGAPLAKTLTTLCTLIETRLPQALCSVLLLSPAGTLHHGAAPRLPRAYCDAIDGASMGPLAGSCGTAAYLRRNITVEDIATDPLWADYRQLALPLSLRACASVPILGADGEVMGTFAIYHRTPGRFDPAELGVLQDFSELATVVIQTERRRLALADAEASLRQAQKLESLGVLAGGIAHDFNNLLTIMLANLSLVARHVGPESPALPFVTDVVGAAKRAADLTKQLLAYSGRAHTVVEPVDLSRLADEMSQLLQVALPKKVRLEQALAASLPLVDGDRAQLQQVLLNLLTNAAEAIGTEPGTVRIVTREVVPGDDHGMERLGADPDVVIQPRPDDAGSYVTLEVSDSGRGMSADVRSRMFDPFFSTKGTSRGLGLSAMLGILRSHHAGLRVRSTPGAGSTFTLYFPRSSATLRAAGRASSPGCSAAIAIRRGVALVVDDEAEVRTSASRLLGALGLEVITAQDGVEALDAVREHGDRLSLVLMDLTMPRMSGNECLVDLRRLRPELPVILSSGYSDAHAAIDLSPQSHVHFLQKPYAFEDVQRVLEEALAEPDRSAG